MTAGSPPAAATVGAGTASLSERDSVGGGTNGVVTIPEAGAADLIGVSGVDIEATGVSDGAYSVAGVICVGTAYSVVDVSFAVDSVFCVATVCVADHCFKRFIPASVPTATITATSIPISQWPLPPRHLAKLSLSESDPPSPPSGRRSMLATGARAFKRASWSSTPTYRAHA